MKNEYLGVLHKQDPVSYDYLLTHDRYGIYQPELPDPFITYMPNDVKAVFAEDAESLRILNKYLDLRYTLFNDICEQININPKRAPSAVEATRILVEYVVNPYEENKAAIIQLYDAETGDFKSFDGYEQKLQEYVEAQFTDLSELAAYKTKYLGTVGAFHTKTYEELVVELNERYEQRPPSSGPEENIESGTGSGDNWLSSLSFAIPFLICIKKPLLISLHSFIILSFIILDTSLALRAFLSKP